MRHISLFLKKKMARLAGLEPATYGLEERSPVPRIPKYPFFQLFIVGYFGYFVSIIANSSSDSPISVTHREKFAWKRRNNP